MLRADRDDKLSAEGDDVLKGGSGDDDELRGGAVLTMSQGGMVDGNCSAVKKTMY